MPEPEYFLRQGDVGLVIRTICRDAAGNAVDIAGASVRFHMSPINGSGTPSIATAATNEDATVNGQVSYTFTSAINTPGLYLAEFQVTYGGGAVQTFPNGDYIMVYVAPQVA